ncbi:hypothetical protein ES705_48348 [subsurface metagenome]
MADQCIQICLDDFMNHTELISKLTVRAGLIEHPKSVFPESAAHRQDGIVLGEVLNIHLPVTDSCA